ncbi:toprim domain-containing protein [Desulfococcus sp.]|uniref:toprim domain-containing protein n=1 Tax=Desulfococcus sp. TaxID=2025834 RepID=UPI003593D05B
MAADIETTFPPDDSDPHRPATVYLQRRGLSEALKDLDYTYWPNVRGTGSGAVMFSISASEDGKMICNGRLLNPPKGEGKTHNIGKTSGLFWMHPGLEYNETDEVFVTEGIIDALSLIEMGQKAVAVLSSGADPAKLDFSWIKNMTLAFDRDRAGIRAFRRFEEYFSDKNNGLQTKPQKMVSVHGDWNDLLMQKGSNKAREMLKDKRKLFEQEASLALAQTHHAYASMLYEFKRQSGLFKYNDRYCYSKTKHSREEIIVVSTEVSDFVLEIAHFELDTTNSERPVYSYRLNIQLASGGSTSCTVEAEEISTPDKMRTTFLKQGRAVWMGDTDATKALLRHIVDTKVPVVRKVFTSGYDEVTGCYMFRTHMIDKDGDLHLPDEKGLFRLSRKDYIKPAEHHSIQPMEGVDPALIRRLIYDAWGAKGLAALSWVTASWFVNQIKQKTGFFPLLSMHGDSQTGKSNLVRILNSCQCFDEEGIPMRKTNTAKGELRKIGQKSGAFIAMLEWPSDGAPTRFDLDTILTLFNINPLQVRAVKSNDIQTTEIKFPGALMFVQNNEPFKTKQQKERVISLEFKDTELNEITFKAFKELETISCSHKAWFYAAVMRRRTYIEENWHEEYERAKRALEHLNVSSRLQETHAIVLGFHNLVSQILGDAIDIGKYILDVVHKKQDSCLEKELTPADQFFEILLKMDQKDMKAFFDIKSGHLMFNLPDSERYIQEQGYRLHYGLEPLPASLKKHPAFVRSNKTHRFEGNPDKAWVFRCEYFVAEDSEDEPAKA